MYSRANELNLIKRAILLIIFGFFVIFLGGLITYLHFDYVEKEHHEVEHAIFERDAMEKGHMHSLMGGGEGEDDDGDKSEHGDEDHHDEDENEEEQEDHDDDHKFTIPTFNFTTQTNSLNKKNSTEKPTKNIVLFLNHHEQGGHHNASMLKKLEELEDIINHTNRGYHDYIFDYLMQSFGPIFIGTGIVIVICGFVWMPVIREKCRSKPITLVAQPSFILRTDQEMINQSSSFMKKKKWSGKREKVKDRDDQTQKDQKIGEFLEMDREGSVSPWRLPPDRSSPCLSSYSAI